MVNFRTKQTITMDQIVNTFSSQEYSKCLKLCNKRLVIFKNDFDTLAYKANCLKHLKKYRQAISILDFCINMKAEQIFYLFVSRGDCHNDLGDYEKACGDYWKALKLEPNTGAVLDKFARSLFRIGLYEDAITYISKAVQLCESPEPVIIMITMLKNLGLDDRAFSVAESGVKDFPDDMRIRIEYRLLSSKSKTLH